MSAVAARKTQAISEKMEQQKLLKKTDMTATETRIIQTREIIVL